MTSSTAVILTGESGSVYIVSGRNVDSRVREWFLWNNNEKFIGKGPDPAHNAEGSWAAFHQDESMRRLFQEQDMISRWVDFIPTGFYVPLMVLVPFEQTLWEARHRRPMTTLEIKWIMKRLLLNIQQIHLQNFVHTEITMENIGITGFDNNKPTETVHEIIVYIASCGSICRPNSKPGITSRTYRSPEVYFGKAWGYGTDTWSWGIIFAQLLLAQKDFYSPGMLDAILTFPNDNVAQVLRERIAADFDLFHMPYYTQALKSDRVLPSEGNTYKWTDDMMEKGNVEADIRFVVEVLDPHPGTRPTVHQLLNHWYLSLAHLNDGYIYEAGANTG
ncbi:kinase-like domain-containing protein [Xylaria venustula]|nr:kinase-like domain-containing protein [Xylaria venustula]